MKVEGFIKGEHVVSEKQLYDRSYEIVIEVSMVGKDGLISGLESQLFPNDIDAQTQTDGSVTSLIVDARGLGISPAISPRIYDEDGKEFLSDIEDDEEWEKVADAWQELVDNEEI
jgi:hypothetical protein